MEIEVNAIVLKWARESLKIPLSAAAKKIGVDDGILSNWENHDSRISLSKLRKIAEAYKRSLGCFLLDKIPHEEGNLPDYRKTNRNDNDGMSTPILLSIRRAREIQENSINLELNTYSSNHPVARLDSNPIDVSKEFREYLNIDSDDLYQMSQIKDAFVFWKRILEGIMGVLIIEVALPKDEIKAFSLNHSLQPLIIINSKDEVSSKIFSLFHETYHILLGKEGVCKYKISIFEKNQTEILCNKFAASFLVPEDDLLYRIRDDNLIDHNGISEQAILTLSRLFKVSRFVILGRLLSLNLIDEKYFRDKFDKWEKEYRNIPEKSGGGGPETYISMVINNNSLPFATGVIDAYNQKKITLRDTSLLLRTKIKHIESISKKVRDSYGSSSSAI